MSQADSEERVQSVGHLMALTWKIFMKRLSPVCHCSPENAFEADFRSLQVSKIVLLNVVSSSEAFYLAG